MGGRVFICYRRQDTAGYALALHEHLRRLFGPGRIFMDVGSLQPGEDFLKTIVSAIHSCSVFLLLIGPRWQPQSLTDPGDFVRVELMTALGNPRIRIIPVLFEGATLPASGDLPAPLASLEGLPPFKVSSAELALDLDRLASSFAGLIRDRKEAIVRFSFFFLATPVALLLLLALMMSVMMMVSYDDGEADAVGFGAIVFLLPLTLCILAGIAGTLRKIRWSWMAFLVFALVMMAPFFFLFPAERLLGEDVWYLAVTFGITVPLAVLSRWSLVLGERSAAVPVPKAGPESPALSPAAPKKILICYREEDAAGFAHLVHESCCRVFGRERILMGNGDLRADILLEGDSVLILCIGPRWQRQALETPDDPIRLVLEVAVRCSIRIIPVLFQGAAMPSPADLPDTLKTLVQFHAFEIGVSDFRSDMRALMIFLKGLTDRRKRRFMEKAFLWIGLPMLVFTLLLAVLGMLYMTGDNPSRQSLLWGWSCQALCGVVVAGFFAGLRRSLLAPVAFLIAAIGVCSWAGYTAWEKGGFDVFSWTGLKYAFFILGYGILALLSGKIAQPKLLLD